MRRTRKIPGPRIVAHTMSYPPFRRIGAELATHGLLEHLADAGWRALVVPHTVPQALPQRLDRVHIVTHDLARTCRPDVVLAHVPFTLQASAMAAEKGVPLVCSGHGGPSGWLAANAAGIDPAPRLLLANSAAMAAGLRRTGIPVQVLRPPVAWPTQRAEPDGLAVTLVNASQDKGGLLVRELARRHPHIPFLIVEGGYGVQVLIEGPNVVTLPHGTSMDQVWGMTRLLLMPSREESWGMVAVEAMARGIPVLGSTAQGLAECLGPGMPQMDHTDIAAWSATLAASYEDAWPDLHIAAVRRGAELDPASDLLAAQQAIAGLIGQEGVVSTVRYRNVRTEQVVDVDPETFIGRRLAGDPLVWVPIETSDPAPAPGVGSDLIGQARPDMKLPDVVRPKQSASVGDWVTYAVACGADRRSAEQAPKATLIALYGE